MDDQDFRARPYQVDLLQIAIQRNTIVFLPTGSGKTFIALQMLKYLSSELEKSLDSGGKRSIFLVNTVPLVEQQAKFIKSQTFIKNVGEYTGAKNVDNWTREKWLNEFNQHKVLVMTTQILVDVLNHGYLSLSNINLIIMDECHHTIKEHPMRQLMLFYKNRRDENISLRILGLTASLINSNCKPHNVEIEINTLETSMGSTIATIDNMESVLGFSANPRERIVFYDNQKTPQIITDLISELSVTTDKFAILQHGKVIPEHESMVYMRGGCKDARKTVCNMIRDFIEDMITLGPFGAHESVKIRHLEVEQMKRVASNRQDAMLYSQLITVFMYVKKKLRAYMESQGAVEQIYQNSTPKVLKLIEVIKEYSPKQNNKKLPLKAIIFVQRRFTANMLYQIFKALSRECNDFNFIQPEFVIGMSNRGMIQGIESALDRKWCKKALIKFRYGDANLLIASNVLEEGIDVPECSLVVRFDSIQNYCSYTQSKGRARSKDSEFITLVCADDKDKFMTKYYQFKEVEKNLLHLLVGKTNERIAPSLDDFEDPIIPPYETDQAQATLLSAISLVNRYCSALPQDMFTHLTVNYFREHKVIGNFTRYRVMLQFPIMCKLREGIMSDWMTSIKNAKRHAALCAVKLLHETGELDDHLMPITNRKLNEMKELQGYFDHWLRSEPTHDAQGNFLSKPGTRGRFRLHNRIIPQDLKRCGPVADNDVYLHVLEISADYSKPSELDNRALKFYNMLNSKQTYAFLSSKPFPYLCDFPLFLSVGRLHVKLRMNHGFLSLTNNDIKRIRLFNVMLFKDVLQVLKSFLICDTLDEEVSLLVCPVDTNWNIDWQIIDSFPELIIPDAPTHQQRKEMVIDPENYRDAIVVPWYRNITSKTIYIVTRVCEEMSPLSNFPTESYDTYNSYFRDKYHLEACHMKQPLLEVKPFSFNKLNCLKPRASKSKKYFNIDLDSSAFDEHLVPEFCVIIKYPAILYLKSALLPSIFHRFLSMMRARELINIINTELNLSEPYFKTSPIGCRIELMHDPEEPDSSSKCNNQAVNLDQASDSSSNYSHDSDIMDFLPKLDSKDLTNYDFEIQKLNKEYDWDVSIEPVDFHRNADDTLKVDMDYYYKFVKNKIDDNIETENNVPLGIDHQQLAICYEDTPIPLTMLNEHSQIVELKDMLAVLTAKTANDLFDLERLETLGDSFLKFAVTLYLADKFRDLNEGHLTSFKGQIIGNKNLMYCGLNKHLAGYMNIYEFAPCADWIPPGFTLSKDLKTNLINRDVSAEMLYGQQIPKEEVLSGVLSPQTLKAMLTALNEICEDSTESNTNTLQNLVGMLNVSDKTIADCIEALIGQYLLSHGVNTCLSLLAFLKILPYSDELVHLMESEAIPAKLSNEITESDIDYFIPGYATLEKSLGYQFKDRSYLLQALTHASYSMNRLTDCYQRLEFVGDSILDFLITGHIYEHCGLLSPGELTDLRSALVNNNTFASLTVRYGFHEHILSLSPSLADSINKFVSFQEQRGHKVDLELLHLLEEGECSVVESVDVPKVLGDIFESLACAVFFDSGKNLNVVWNVFSKLMNNEIKMFSKNVPKQIVRQLYETNCKPKFGDTLLPDKSNCVAISLTFSHEGKLHTVYGVGVNKQNAKKAASKMALQMMGRH